MAESKRRLAAILSADVAGYSRLMGADEEATIAALDECRRVGRMRIVVTRDRQHRTCDTVSALQKLPTASQLRRLLP